MQRHIIIVLAALGFVACAQLQPGAPESEVAAYGKAPAATYDNPDGSRQLVFPTGPLGTETYMVHVKAGAVQRVEQVLTDQTFGRIQAGVTTQQEVRRMIGPPWRVVRFDNLRQDAWDYRFRDTWGYLADFSVMLDDRGIVAGKVVARIESGRDSGMQR